MLQKCSLNRTAISSGLEMAESLERREGGFVVLSFVLSVRLFIVFQVFLGLFLYLWNSFW